jgi:hypothetical protein
MKLRAWKGRKESMKLRAWKGRKGYEAESLER